MSRRALLLLLVVLMASSCSWLRPKPDEPLKLGQAARVEPEPRPPVKAVTPRPVVAKPAPAEPTVPAPQVPTVAEPAPPTEPAPQVEPLKPAHAKATYEPDPNVVGTVVAVVNGDIVTKEEVLSEVRGKLDAIDADASLTPVGKEAKRKEVISGQLMYKVERLLALQEARRVITVEEEQRIETDVDTLVKDTIRTLGTTTELEDELAKKGQTIEEQKQTERDNRRIRALLASEIDAHVDVTPGEMQAYYAAHRGDYESKAQVKIRQIFLSWGNHASRQEATDKGRDLLKRIRNGEDFGGLAEQYSDGPYAKGGGLWEFVTEGSGAFRPEVEKVAFSLGPKQVSDVISSEIGVHIIKVEDVHRARTAPFPEVQDKISAKLRADKRQHLYRQLIKKLWDKSYVDVRWR